jgi:cytochrome c peroxidase
MFQKMGLIQPYETDNPAQGRYALTGNEGDRMVFKVPTLRNIELTYPYFHDGGAETLDEAVRVMGRLQLGREFSDSEVAQLVAFLKTLTGDMPQFALPVLPPSTPDTPRPNPYGP